MHFSRSGLPEPNINQISGLSSFSHFVSRFQGFKAGESYRVSSRLNTGHHNGLVLITLLGAMEHLSRLFWDVATNSLAK